ncbi:hypothetical protein CPHO_00070 [Corynebacterium phocae]|uniref:Uncharacterized protein n=1 Tax=Corynebacterium phocae TaxID=161895 RepID=A0A1L7D0J8_9CORY|nr:hypothetical protein [Corynebacterium phocae]APT91593.1 hypothetical protein CPHO_00070 [Corynebacterium phocae]KAA8720661.1 hypothetical protein F4V58_11925 [Corynebacterium phocae]
MKTLVPGVIAGGLLGLVLWLASGTFWFLPIAVALGVAVVPLALREEPRFHSRKKRDENFRD